jgi:hypothetical protein
MKRVLSGLMVTLLIAWPAFANDSLDDAGLRGSIECSLTGALFPPSVGEPVMLTYTGSMELEADGNGRFVGGHMTTKGVGDMNELRGRRSCDFSLKSGTYAVNADGTGQSQTTWTVWEGGGFTGRLCSTDNLSHRQHFQGLDLNNTRMERKEVIESFVVANKPAGMMYWVGMDENGVTVAVCKRKQ